MADMRLDAPAQTPRKGKSPASKSRKKGSIKDYTSDGVADNDIFSLPSNDWQILGVLTLVATVVRLFRIYQPTSVVFDEVQ